MNESTPRHAATRAVAFTAVALEDGFWAPRQRAVRDSTLPFLYGQHEKFGMVDALDVHAPAGPLSIPFLHKPATPVMYWDSDWGKWIETAGYVLSLQRDPKLEAQVDAIIDKIALAQEADGYFNTYFQRRAPDKKWSNLRDWHELYCAGHLIEGAVAYAAATGKTKLLDVMRRYVDHIDRRFGPGPGQQRGYCGHEEIELALVKLHRFTGEARYLKLARYFIDERGRQPHYFEQEMRARGEEITSWFHRTYEYNQSHRPVREQDKVVGHAVRAMYLYSAMADLAAEDGDAGLHAACERLWQDLTTKRLYVTGGLGPSATNEGFTRDYDLPNESAYAETCAAVGLVFWSHRMLLATGESRFADVMERALYNGAASGLSLSGDRFFYDNPLASRGGHERWTWHRCPCCPANIGRLVASVGQYVCSTDDTTLSVHLYARCRIDARVGEHAVKLRQETEFPWQGVVTMTLDLAAPASFALRLRIPDWSPDVTISVNGTRLDAAGPRDRGYLRLERSWAPGDVVRLDLAMPVRPLWARSELHFDIARTALQRGPFIYCVEEADTGVDVECIAIDAKATPETRFEPALLGGVMTLSVPALVIQKPASGDALYLDHPPSSRRTTVKAIPYPVWAHRASGTMAVWLRTIGDG